MMTDRTTTSGWAVDEAPVVDAAADAILALLDEDTIWKLYMKYQLDRGAVEYFDNCNPDLLLCDPIHLMRVHVFGLIQDRLLRELPDLHHIVKGVSEQEIEELLTKECKRPAAEM